MHAVGVGLVGAGPWGLTLAGSYEVSAGDYTAPIVTLTDHHDYFLLQLSVEPTSGTLCFNAHGFFAAGTQAAPWYFTNVIFPSLPTYTDSWYIVEWTDGANQDGVPGPTDTFTLIGHGR